MVKSAGEYGTYVFLNKEGRVRDCRKCVILFGPNMTEIGCGWQQFHDTSYVFDYVCKRTGVFPFDLDKW